MKQLRKFLIVLPVMFCFQTGSTFAQFGSLFNIGGHAALALAGGEHQSKQEKLIDQSSKHEKIAGSNTTMLRVKEAAIKSKAKKNIIALQNRLDQYELLYKNNQPIELPKNDSDISAIQNLDENWPVDYYITELRAYKRYALQQKQKMATDPAHNVSATPVSTIKKDSAGAKSE